MVSVARVMAPQSSGSGVEADTAKVNGEYHYSVAGRAYYGFLLAHRRQMAHLTGEHSGGFEMALSRQGRGVSSVADSATYGWEQLYGYPRIGLAAGVYNLGNPEILGMGYALQGYVYFPLIRTPRLRFGYRCSSGAGWVEKPFRRVENFQNNAISSHINLFVQLLFEEEWFFSRRASFLCGISMMHFSNGAFRVPNLGVNFVMVSGGFRYRLGEPGVFIRRDLPPPARHLYFSIDGGFSLKEISPAGGAKYPVFAGSWNAALPVSRKRDAGLGIYFSHDASNLVSYNDDDSHPHDERQAAFIRSGIHISHALNIGRMSAIAQMGVYLYTRLKTDGSLYHRLIYRYYLTDHLFIHLAIKTHWAVADHMEWGAGWKF